MNTGLDFENSQIKEFHFRFYGFWYSFRFLQVFSSSLHLFFILFFFLSFEFHIFYNHIFSCFILHFLPFVRSVTLTLNASSLFFLRSSLVLQPVSYFHLISIPFEFVSPHLSLLDLKIFFFLLSVHFPSYFLRDIHHYVFICPFPVNSISIPSKLIHESFSHFSSSLKLLLEQSSLFFTILILSIIMVSPPPSPRRRSPPPPPHPPVTHNELLPQGLMVTVAD